ncbi:MAG TPA: DNA primase [Gemmatimonadales bacterium]
MSGIPDEIIEQVRDAADMIEIIGEHVALKRTGADYRGPCPFHGGTKRNLAVIPRKQMYYCFVCHEGGDVFTFFMKQFGMDYPTAVREVAGKVGVVIPERTTSGPDPREPLYSAVAVAHDWYQRQLREAPDAARARTYLEGRGYQLETLLPYGLGYAPGGQAFLDAMRTLGIELPTLVTSGLAVDRDGKVRARFWDRLLFPIHDLRARVVGFGGRVLGDGEPKYLNSPDGEIFHKGRLLYHLHAAKHAIRKTENAVVVEGYFDVLRLVEAGIEHAVAPLGTGFTADQAQLLRRVTDRVTLLFDSDAAGLRATFRTADALLRAQLRVVVASLPEGEDPDTLVQRHGVKALETVLRDAVDVFERKVQILERKGWLQSLAGRRRALDRLLPTLRAAADPVTRDLYISRVTEVLGVSRESVLREIADQPTPPAAPRSPDAPRTTSPTRHHRAGPERNLVRAMVHEADLRRRIADLVPDRAVIREPDASVFAVLAAAREGQPAGELLDALTGEPRALLAAILAETWGPPDVDALVTGELNKLDSRRLEYELREVKRRIPLATETDKPALVAQVDALSRKIARQNPGRWNVISKGRGSAP